MSFQAYLDAIQKITKQTPEQIKRKADKDNLLTASLTATTFVDWLQHIYDLGRGHSMALWKYFIEKGWIVPAKGTSKIKKRPTLIKVEATINLPLENVWHRWTNPKHIIHWNFATPDWQCPRAKNDLTKGGQFVYRMEAKDGSGGFDFSGKYVSVKTNQQIEAVLDDSRTLTISFQNLGKQTKVTEVFEAETMNSVALQKQGWQQILNQFKTYCETK
jgi:uncharacterized protein YndB with AHSA1/START domain